MNTTLTAFLNDLISSSIACSPKGSLHIKSSYDLTGASPKTRRAVQLGYHSTKTKSAGILDNVMNEVSNNKTLQSVINEVSTNKALQAGLAGAAVGGGLTALTGKSDPEESLTHRTLRVLGNATLAGGLTGAAAYSIPKGIEEFSQALPSNDVNPVDRITGSSPVRGLTTLGGLGVAAVLGKNQPSILSGYNDLELDSARKLWRSSALPASIGGKAREALLAASKSKTIDEARTGLAHAIQGESNIFNGFLSEKIPLSIGTLEDQLMHGGINYENGLANRSLFNIQNLTRNMISKPGLLGLARLGTGAAAGYFAPDVANAIGEKLYNTVTKH